MGQIFGQPTFSGGQIGMMQSGDGCEDGFHNCSSFLPYGGHDYPEPSENPFVRGPIASNGGEVPDAHGTTVLTPAVTPTIASAAPAQNETDEGDEGLAFGLEIAGIAVAAFVVGMLFLGKDK